MPTADSANSKPKNSSSARTMLAAILRSDRVLPVPCSRRFSIAAETHSASTITTPAVSVPSSMSRRDRCAAPTFQCTSSIASSSRGSAPVTHSTTASQASHDTLRSMTRTQRVVGKVALSTRTARRMMASAISIGSASLNTAGFTTPASASLAANARASASTGNSTPSTMRLPNQIESAGAVAPRNKRPIAQASSKQPASTPASVRALICSSDFSRSKNSSAFRVGAMPGATLRGPPAHAHARRRCAPMRPGCSRPPGTRRCGLSSADRPRP